MFSPKYKLPIDLYDNGVSHFNVKMSLEAPNSRSPRGRSFYRKQASPHFYKGASDASKTLTTGMNDAVLSPISDHPLPKHTNTKGGQISNDFGLIPNLREPFVPNKRIEFF